MKWSSLFFLLCFAANASANTELSYNRISFTVSSEAHVENDKLIAKVFASERGENAQQLAAKVNESITWGITIAKKSSSVEARTLNYSTNPEYKDGKVIAWRVKQSIQLESADSKVLSDLLGELQQKLNVESIQYEVSSGLRKQIEEKLIAKAMGKFKQRASQISQNMGRKSYRVVRLNVSNSFTGGLPRYPMKMMQGSYARSSAMPAPSLEAGKQKIVVNIQAEIELSEENGGM